MVLDYSKVHSIRRPTTTASSESLGAGTATPKLASDSLLDTYVDCDLALITEEVVEGNTAPLPWLASRLTLSGMATGHLSRHSTNVPFDDVGTPAYDMLASLPVRADLRRLLCTSRVETELILDIQCPSNWLFYTQPGAFRRIVMNLFGNSLKYTRHGYIAVSLRAQHEPCSTPDSISHGTSEIVQLVVQDTGQGISPEYLRTKIFTPFAQENTKSTGTGLGLSIVRSIVDMLGGNIDIKSILNVGTIVTVTIRE